MHRDDDQEIQRRRRGTWWVTACVAAGAGCTDPQPRVLVTLTGIGAALGARISNSATVEVIWCGTPAGDAATPGESDAALASCAAGEIQRGIFWDRSDPFSFAIQVPERDYRGARVVLITGVICGSGTAQRAVLARGQLATAFRPTLAADTPQRLTVTSVEVSCP